MSLLQRYKIVYMGDSIVFSMIYKYGFYVCAHWELNYQRINVVLTLIPVVFMFVNIKDVPNSNRNMPKHGYLGQFQGYGPLVKYIKVVTLLAYSTWQEIFKKKKITSQRGHAGRAIKRCILWLCMVYLNSSCLVMYCCGLVLVVFIHLVWILTSLTLHSTKKFSLLMHGIKMEISMKFIFHE